MLLKVFKDPKVLCRLKVYLGSMHLTAKTQTMHMCVCACVLLGGEGNEVAAV